VPHPEDLDSSFTTKSTQLICGQHISARATCSANTQTSQINISWSITNRHKTCPETLIQHQNTIQSHQQETRNKRGLQLGIIGIHIVISALETIQVTATAITLDTGAHTIYNWTHHTAPRQGFNCLAKHNTDVRKELQSWVTRTKNPFTEPDTTYTSHTDNHSDSEDDTDILICHSRLHPHTTPPTPPMLYPPTSKFKLTIDNTDYNFLPERLIRERHHLPLDQKFLKDNCGLALNQFDNVAWELAATTISELSITRTLPVLKFTANEWYTGDKQQTHFQKGSKCPLCNEENTTKHIFTCNHPLASPSATRPQQASTHK
jgi:hypothetical protein